MLELAAAGEAPAPLPLTVDLYVRMAEEGLLPTTPRVELIDGFLVPKDRRDAGGDIMTIGPLHVRVSQDLYDALAPRLRGSGFHAKHQAPVALPPIHAPEPDVSVIHGTSGDYSDRLPGPKDTAAVMEVSYSSLKTDRTAKLERYAGAGIPVYWIVDLEKQCVRVMTRPIAGKRCYGKEVIHHRDATIRLPLSRSQAVEIPVAEFLPE
jgi:hypothetical protein